MPEAAHNRWIRTGMSFVPFSWQLPSASHQVLTRLAKSNMKYLRIIIYLCFYFLVIKNRPKEARLSSLK